MTIPSSNALPSSRICTSEALSAHEMTCMRDWGARYLAAAFARIGSVVLVQRGLWNASGGFHLDPATSGVLREGAADERVQRDGSYR